MTKKNEAASKKVSKAKTVKVNNDQFDLIIDFGPAHLAAEQKEIEQHKIYLEECAAKSAPWYKRLGKAIKNWLKRKK